MKSQDFSIHKQVESFLQDWSVPHQLRGEDPYSKAAKSEYSRSWRAMLDKLNAALSLIVGIEYPSAGIRRQIIESARDTLRGV